jgi:hypothetical protein
VIGDISSVPIQRGVRLGKSNAVLLTVTLNRSDSMSIEIAHKNEARITGEAQTQGISMDAQLERLMSESRAAN